MLAYCHRNQIPLSKGISEGNVLAWYLYCTCICIFKVFVPIFWCDCISTLVLPMLEPYTLDWLVGGSEFQTRKALRLASLFTSIAVQYSVGKPSHFSVGKPSQNTLVSCCLRASPLEEPPLLLWGAPQKDPFKRLSPKQYHFVLYVLSNDSTQCNVGIILETTFLRTKGFWKEMILSRPTSICQNTTTARKYKIHEGHSKSNLANPTPRISLSINTSTTKFHLLLLVTKKSVWKYLPIEKSYQRSTGVKITGLSRAFHIFKKKF